MRNLAPKVVLSFSLFTLLVGSSFPAAYAAVDSQTVRFDQKVEIPGATLDSGSYSLSVEDRLPDRAIVRITSDDSAKHYLLLAVPASNVDSYAQNNLALFSSQDGKTEALKAWKCPGCAGGLEFVYPKDSAAKLTSSTADSVLAYDPAYDKLPAKLSADDMKVVSLWLLSPQRIGPGHKGEGLNAAKYTAPPATAAPTMASAEPTAASPSLPSAPEPTVAIASDARGGLPKTASDIHLFGLAGLLAICLGLGLGRSGRKAFSR